MTDNRKVILQGVPTKALLGIFRDIIDPPEKWSFALHTMGRLPDFASTAPRELATLVFEELRDRMPNGLDQARAAPRADPATD